MMRGASGDECGNLVLGQEYNRPAEAGVLKKPRGSDFNFNILEHYNSMTVAEIKFDIHVVRDSPTKINQNNIAIMVATFNNISK
jgi:hypothetical protein